MKKKLILLIVPAVIFAAVLTTSVLPISKPSEPALCMVIDAGHGGMDLGASAADGTGEPDITLAVAKALAKEAKLYGIAPILTREDENGLLEEGSDKWTKLSDMRQRKKIISMSCAQIVISIHLNSFTQDSAVRGAQVFYPDELSKPLAQAIQEEIRLGIDDGTNRKALSKKDMYLFKDTEGKKVLVECGFLSNPVDLAFLKVRKHQQNLAKCILKGVLKEENIPFKLREKTEVIDSRTKSE